MGPSVFSAAGAGERIPAVSEEYSDVIVRLTDAGQGLDALLSLYSWQAVDSQYSILYAPLSEGLSSAEAVGYSGMPKLYTFLNTASLERSGILAAQNQPSLNLKGQGVLLGFLDSGIDYTHPAFRRADGSTRILRIWDQGDQDGTPPSGFSYGTEYTDTQINELLRAPVPPAPLDPDGHGTAAAGIACGSADVEADFIGAAPESGILFVRLKGAKQYLRDYFRIPREARAFQENDLMLGVRYLLDTARLLAMPLVICSTLGTNQGGHIGATPLEEVLAAAQLTPGIYAVTGTGNEAGMAHHYEGRLGREKDTVDVEILVEEGTEGFSLEFWTDPLELYSIGFLSPLGESIPAVYPRPITSRQFEFLLEPTEISLFYSIVEMQTGQQLALIRFTAPSPGVWRLRITNETFVNGIFHLWLPITGLADPGLRFLAPNPNTTLTPPSCAEAALSISTYDGTSGSIYLRSGRGYTRDNRLKPDLAAPGVDLTAPLPGGRYGSLTGSSASSALAAGAAALLAQWGLSRFQYRYLSAREMKNLFLRGAGRGSLYTYPNREWGYGSLDLYGIFENLSRS